jgi:hypothetical protein
LWSGDGQTESYPGKVARMPQLDCKRGSCHGSSSCFACERQAGGFGMTRAALRTACGTFARPSRQKLVAVWAQVDLPGFCIFQLTESNGVKNIFGDSRLSYGEGLDLAGHGVFQLTENSGVRKMFIKVQDLT